MAQYILCNFFTPYIVSETESEEYVLSAVILNESSAPPPVVQLVGGKSRWTPTTHQAAVWLGKRGAAVRYGKLAR